MKLHTTPEPQQGSTPFAIVTSLAALVISIIAIAIALGAN
jgi:hypothetical protein